MNNIKNELKKIPTADVNISTYYKFSLDSEPIILLNNKINIIYANNGVGKTTFIQEKLSPNNEDFFVLDLYENIEPIENSNKMLISKNIVTIKRIEKEIEEICSNITDIIKNTIEDFNYSTGNKNEWKIHVQPYLLSNNIFPKISTIVKSKKDNKILKLTLNDVFEIFKELQNYNFFLNEEQNKYFNLQELEINFLEIKQAKTFILNEISNANQNIKEQVIKKTINEYRWINISILEHIYDCILNLDEMKKCYICWSEIKDFENIKIEMKNRIEELKKNYPHNFDFIPYLKKWDKNFNTKLYELYYMFKFDEIKNDIKVTYQNYENYLIKFPYLLYKKFIIETKVDYKKLSDLIDRKKILEQERELSVIKNEDLEMMKIILNNILGKERIRFDFKLQKQKFITIENLDNELPFSTGETRLISFIISTMFFISTDNYKKKILVIDDIEDSLDTLNRTNFIYVLKKFNLDYKLNCLVLTHNSLLIKEIWNQGIKNLNIFLLFKTKFNDERKIVGLKEENKKDIEYLAFDSGMKQFKDLIAKKYNEFNEVEKVLIFNYIIWLIRIKYLIWGCDNEKLHHEKELFFDFLRYENLFYTSSENEKDFKIILKHAEKFLNGEKNIFSTLSHKKFCEAIQKIKERNEVELLNIFSELMRNNIINLTYILILREELRKYINDLCDFNQISFDDKEKYEVSIRKKLEILNNKGIITLFDRNYFNYCWNFLSSFYHNEINPSFLLNGIELNKTIIDRMAKNLKEKMRVVK